MPLLDLQRVSHLLRLKPWSRSFRMRFARLSILESLLTLRPVPWSYSHFTNKVIHNTEPRKRLRFESKETTLEGSKPQDQQPIAAQCKLRSRLNLLSGKVERGPAVRVFTIFTLKRDLRDIDNASLAKLEF